MGLFDAIFGPRIRLPRDQTTRVPRKARKAAADHVSAMQSTLDALGGLSGIADVKSEKRVPEGFYDRAEELLRHYDGYVEVISEQLGLSDLPRAGDGPDGAHACHAAPVGVSATESMLIYRKMRPWKDFPAVAQGMASLAEQQFKDVTENHSGSDPEKIRMTGRAVQKGRMTFAKRGATCPLLDPKSQRCRAWDVRPIQCRMHHLEGEVALHAPTHAKHGEATAKNLRLPVRQQVAVGQLDKRMDLGLSPFMWAAVLQLLEMMEGEMLLEKGEAPRPMGQDGRVQQRANRNVKHAKKNKKGKGKGKGKKRK